jgi:hypothetical protein
VQDPTFDDIELRQLYSKRGEGDKRDVQNIASAAHASLLFATIEKLIERDNLTSWEEEYRDEYGGLAEETS